MSDWLNFSPRTKSVALLVLTLLLGVVLGGVLNAWWARERFERIRQLRAPGGLETVLLNTIEPTSPEQRQQVQAVLDDTASRVRALRRAHRQELRATLDSMRTALAPFLSEEQKERLRERMRRRVGPPRWRQSGQAGPPHDAPQSP
jgi:hypothetical protein